MISFRNFLNQISDDQPRRIHTEVIARITVILLSVIAAFGIAYGVRYRLELNGVTGYTLAVAMTLAVGVALHTVGYKLIMSYERSIILEHSVWMDKGGEFLYLFDYVMVDGRNVGKISGRDHDGRPTVTILGQDHGQAYDPDRLEYRERTAK